MADFCRACSIKLFDRDLKELVGITRLKNWEKGEACFALCEGCGYIQVDPEGNCATPNCLRKGQEGHGVPWVGEEP